MNRNKKSIGFDKRLGLMRLFCLIASLPPVDGLGGSLVYLVDSVHVSTFFSEFVHPDILNLSQSQQWSTSYFDMIPFYLAVVRIVPYSTRCTEWEVVLTPLLDSVMNVDRRGGAAFQQELVMQWAMSLLLSSSSSSSLSQLVINSSSDIILQQCVSREDRARTDLQKFCSSVGLSSVTTPQMQQTSVSFMNYLLEDCAQDLALVSSRRDCWKSALNLIGSTTKLPTDICTMVTKDLRHSLKEAITKIKNCSMMANNGNGL